MGGVSERPAQEGSRSDPRDRLSPRRWKAPGLRDDVALRGAAPERDLGRSVDVRGGLFLHGRTHRRQRVPLGRRGGERRRRTNQIVRTRREGTACRSRLTGDASFTRSKDPCSSPWRKPRDGAVIAVGQTRATGRNRQRGSPRRTGRGSSRVTAPQGGRVTRQTRKEVAASVPTRITRAPDEVLVRRSSCRSR